MFGRKSVGIANLIIVLKDVCSEEIKRIPRPIQFDPCKRKLINIYQT